jgi:hypothetical protein
MKKLFLIPLLILAGCATTPMQTLSTNNPELQIDVVGKADGCTIYRFRDAGKNHYFVKCIEGTAQAMSMQSCGKNCQYEDRIQTVTTH